MVLSTKGKQLLRGLIPPLAMAVIVATCIACKRAKPIDDSGIDSYYATFDSEDELRNWKKSDSGKWEIKDGALVADARIPEHYSILWLDRGLPNSFQIEFEAECLENANDINCFIHGNGKNYSGYHVIIGGWANTYIAIYKPEVEGDESTRNRLKRVEFQIEKDRVYEVKIVKQGSTIRVMLDGEEVLTADDDEPITDVEHRYFGLSTWENVVRFDNLRIERRDAR